MASDVSEQDARDARREKAKADLAKMRAARLEPAFVTDRIARLAEYREQETERVAEILAGPAPVSFRMRKIAPPTKEQVGDFELSEILDKTSDGMREVGKAYRRKPMIMTLLSQGILSTREYKALHVYRHYAGLAEKSPIRDSLCIERNGGSGKGPTNEIIHAAGMVDRCEQAAESLADILRAVAVDDVSLAQWAIGKHGGKEKRRARGTAIEASPVALGIARIEIKFAAGRVEAELAA